MEKWLPSKVVLKAAEKCPPEWTEPGPVVGENISYRIAPQPFMAGVLAQETQRVYGDRSWVWDCPVRGFRAQAILTKFWTDKCDAAGLSVVAVGTRFAIVMVGNLTTDNNPVIAGRVALTFPTEYDTRLDALATAVLTLEEKWEGK